MKCHPSDDGKYPKDQDPRYLERIGPMQGLSMVLVFLALSGAARGEIYKCPGPKGRPLFTMSTTPPGEACVLQTVKPMMPTEADVATAKAYNQRKAEEEKAAQAEHERRRALRLKAIEAAAAVHQARAQEEAAKARHEANEIAARRRLLPY
ncbi:MAG: hypothetical protein PHE55_09300 [Methylococcaceae bacterium]|nr:hypothetical protein [Methylococcaceae bacterium]